MKIKNKKLTKILAVGSLASAAMSFSWQVDAFTLIETTYIASRTTKDNLGNITGAKSIVIPQFTGANNIYQTQLEKNLMGCNTFQGITPEGGETNLSFTCNSPVGEALCPCVTEHRLIQKEPDGQEILLDSADVLAPKK